MTPFHLSVKNHPAGEASGLPCTSFSTTGSSHLVTRVIEGSCDRYTVKVL